MKLFTEQEMIRVAKAADVYGPYQYQVLSGHISVLTSKGGITISHSYKTGRFSLATDGVVFIHSFDILATAKEIEAILEERKQAVE